MYIVLSITVATQGYVLHCLVYLIYSVTCEIYCSYRLNTEVYCVLVQDTTTKPGVYHNY